MAIDVDPAELDSVAEDGQHSTADADPTEAAAVERGHAPTRTARAALVVAASAVTALAALTAWLGWQAHQAADAKSQRAQFISAARQGALNLTTISYTEADTDVQRILDNATGSFYEDFKTRSGPFIDVVKQAKAQTVGTVTDAALQSVDGDSAHVVVAVAVTTTNAGTPDPQPRAWRMKVTVQTVGTNAKVSNVEFVP